MLDLIIVMLFCWIFFKSLGLAFRIAWGTTKIIVSVLFAIALPMLALCLIFAGGLLLLVPLALVSIAFGVLKVCVS